MIDIRACRWYRVQGHILFVKRSMVDFTKETIALDCVRQEDYAAYEAHYLWVEHQGTYHTKAEVEGIPFPELLSIQLPFSTDIEEVRGIVESTAAVVEDLKALPDPKKRAQP